MRLRVKRPSEKRALLCALTYSAGSITLGRGAMGIQYVTEHGQVGELIARLAGELRSEEHTSNSSHSGESRMPSSA